MVPSKMDTQTIMLSRYVRVCVYVCGGVCKILCKLWDMKRHYIASNKIMQGQLS